MNRLTKILSYILVAVLASTATLGVVIFGMPANDEYTKLEQLSDLIQERFIGEVDKTAMEDAAAAAMISSLGDRWSHYMAADAYDDYKDQMNNSYVGIGITIRVRDDGYFDVLEVVSGGPAEGAGVQAGDVLKYVEGQDCAELGMDATTNLVKGEEGTAVNLTFERGGRTVEVSIVRAYFETEVATWEMLEDRIGYVRIVNFDKRCADETVAAIEAVLAQGARAIVFDVRNNPGGYQAELVKVLDYLLPEGDLFRSEYFDGRTSVDTSDAKCLDIPMAVLVNSESYSAAEFFAAALSEYDAAVVVGEQTCGKGYFQITYELKDGSAVGLSVGKYYTPNGVSLAEVGITPDVVVDVDEETFLQIYANTLPWQEDPQILAAIDALKVGIFP